MESSKPGPKKGSNGARKVAAAHLGSHLHDQHGGFAASPERARTAGQRGAASVKAKLGLDHFRAMGKAGGKAVREKYGSEYYRAIRQMGSKARWNDATKDSEETLVSDSIQTDGISN